MYLREGGTRCTSGRGYPMYIREGGTRCTLGRGEPDVHMTWPVCDIPVICLRFRDLSMGMDYGVYPVYITWGGTRCTSGRGVPDVH